jgi:hypothetical protein
MTLKAIPMLFVLLLSVLTMPVYVAVASTDDANKESEPTKEPESKSESAEEPTAAAAPAPTTDTPKEPEPEATPSEELKATESVPTTAATTEKQLQENKLEAFTSNNDIDPCLLDPSDPICPKPDPDTQDCPEGYAQNEDGNCFPLHPDGCPSGYHGHEDDETGRCIPNSTPCDPGYEFNDDHSNCEKEHFTCDGKPSVVKCEDDNNHDGKDNEKHKHHDRDVIIKHFHDTKIIKKITDSDSNIDVDQTVVAISYDEGKGINCVIEDDNDGQCETFDVTVDKGKEPLLVVIPFDHN